MDSLEAILKKVTFKNYDNNKIILEEMKDKLTKKPFNKGLENTIFIESLYKSIHDKAWFQAQIQAAINQIDKLLNNNSNFHKYYDGILSEHDLIKLSQELIHDLYELDSLSNKKINFEGNCSRPNFLSSNQFFLHAKFSYFTKKLIPETTNRNFLFSSMPTLIRQAIEIKFKNMIGLEKVCSKKGDFKLVSISSILNFFNEKKIFLDLPLPIETLTAINTWTNSFVHSGIIPFCWQSLEAIDLIECLFSIKDEETGSLNINGFSYIATGISLDSIKNALDEKFDANFTLSHKSIEGSLKNRT